MTYHLKCNVSFLYVVYWCFTFFSHQSVRFTSDITMVKLEALDLMYGGSEHGGDIDMDKDDTDWDTELDLTYPDLI